MADTLNQALVTQFTDMVNHEAQQKESFMRGRTIIKPVNGKKFDYQNLASAGDADIITARHQQVTAASPKHERRGALVQSFTKTFLFDHNDDLQSLIDLQSPYVQALAAMMARKFDRVNAEAAIGDVLTGENLTTTTTFSGENGLTVTAGSGLTYDKLREVKQKFLSKGVGLHADEKITLYISDVEHSTLMDQVEVISTDYRRTDYVVDSGKVTNILGMDVVVFPSDPNDDTAILGTSGSVRTCFAAAHDGLCTGINSEIDVRVEPRYDLVDSKQVKAIFRLGALRTEPAKVCKIDVTNS
ncbi:MAG: phage capsid protein [Pseudomonadales bacterium]|nr:phage capsid protein [Pseudomonadales bacterium]